MMDGFEIYIELFFAQAINNYFIFEFFLYFVMILHIWLIDSDILKPRKRFIGDK